MKKFKITFINILLMILIGNLLLGAGKKDITFTYVTSPLNIPSIIEKENKVFEKNLSMKINYAEITSGAQQIQALASKDVDILYAVGATSVILAAANNADIKILNIYSRSPKAFCMYSHDKNIKSPKDLKGKTIAGPIGTILHELLVAYLAKDNMTLKDVKYVNMSIPNAKAALDSQNIDVAIIAGPTAFNAKKQGYNLVTDGENLINAIICVAVREEFSKKNPEIMAKIKKSQHEILELIKKDIKKTYETVAKTINISVSDIEEMAKDYDFAIEITENDKEGLQHTADFLYNLKMIDKKIDTSSLFL